jgi:hypothetical protein
VLPVYKAHSFERILKKGGRTKPWLILVKDENRLVPYVVKMFSTTLIDSIESVVNEVLGNVLAQEFELKVPKAAFIEMDIDFQMTIRDSEAIEYFDQGDDRLKFGSRLISPAIEYQPETFEIKDIKDLTDIDSIFAFDNLIRNRDRTPGKPNFLISGKEGYMIDHELGFQIDSDTKNEILTMFWNQNLCRYHIFFDYLCSSVRKSREQFFDLFAEYLRFLNISNLDVYFNQLSQLGYSCKKRDIITDYLQTMKANSANFAILMRDIIK